MLSIFLKIETMSITASVNAEINSVWSVPIPIPIKL